MVERRTAEWNWCSGSSRTWSLRAKSNCEKPIRTNKFLPSEFTYCSLPQLVLFFRKHSSEIDGFTGSFRVDPCCMYHEQPLTNHKSLRFAG
jgi:hypothetical protein